MSYAKLSVVFRKTGNKVDALNALSTGQAIKDPAWFDEHQMRLKSGALRGPFPAGYSQPFSPEAHETGLFPQPRSGLRW